MLEPRDQVMEHEFNFQLQLSTKNVEELKSGKVSSNIQEKIKTFLVESSGNVTSAAFKLLCKGDFTDQEAKEFASKNIKLNLNSIIKETTRGIKDVEKVDMKLKEEEKVRKILLAESLSQEQIDYILNNNWDQLKTF